MSKRNYTQIKASETAKDFRQSIKSEIASLGTPLNLVGFLSTEQEASVTYSDYTKSGCEDVGISFDLRSVNPESIEQHIAQANADKDVHGILIYYPIFQSSRDTEIRSLVNPTKDVEGLNSFWLSKLYANERYYDEAQTKKAILPCTPLAILKLLDASGCMNKNSDTPFEDLTISIFNRSEVVGEPLAFMISNDGAKVYSFDVNDVLCFEPGGEMVNTSVSRADALAESDIIITGVPSEKFDIVKASEVKDGVVAVNFSAIANFEESVKDKAAVYLPRIGAVTVAMCLRNTLRLYKNFHAA